MKFTITRENFLPALQQVSGVIERRQTLPILANVLLNLAENGSLEMTGTDLEVQLITRTTVESGDSGRITVPARKLLDICRLLPDKSVLQIEAKDDRFAIKSGGSRFTLSTLPAENYPEFDSGTPDLEVSVPAQLLRRALDKTTFAMAQQDVRYYLNGLLVELSGAVLRTVASDGHRLAYFEESLDEAGDFSRQIIVPRKGILELARLLGDYDGSIRVEIARNSIRIEVAALVFAAKLIEGRFPDYQRVMPRDLVHGYKLEKELLRGALTRVAVLSNEKYKSISMEVNGAEASMALAAQNPEHEEAEERLEVVLESGENVSVGFNAAYLLDALQNVDSEQVKLSFTETANSCLIEDCADSRFRYVVMPMRL